MTTQELLDRHHRHRSDETAWLVRAGWRPASEDALFWYPPGKENTTTREIAVAVQARRDQLALDADSTEERRDRIAAFVEAILRGGGPGNSLGFERATAQIVRRATALVDAIDAIDASPNARGSSPQTQRPASCSAGCELPYGIEAGCPVHDTERPPGG